uniref:Uncharacterized protein n=1 Tax=Strigamia maritima TaxID=126957 RepID=T1J1F5_STRMM
MMVTQFMCILFLTMQLVHLMPLANKNEITALNDKMNIGTNNQDDIIHLKKKNPENESNQEVVIRLMNQDKVGKIRGSTNKRRLGKIVKFLWRGVMFGRNLFCKFKPNNFICGK